MFSRFPNFLQSSLRILNIADRALPLMKEISPTIKTIKGLTKKISTITPPKNIKNNVNKNYTTKKNVNYVKNNSLTFFK